MRCRNLYSFKRSQHSPNLPLASLQRPLHSLVSLQRPLHSLVSLQRPLSSLVSVQRPLHSLVSLRRPLSSTSPDSEAGSGRWLYAGLLGLLGLGPKEEVEEEDALTLAVKRGILAIQVLARPSLSTLCRRETWPGLTGSSTSPSRWPRTWATRRQSPTYSASWQTSPWKGDS